MKPEPTNMNADKPTNRAANIQAKRPKSIWIKMRNVVVAIVLFCLVGIIGNLIGKGMHKIFQPVVDFVFENTGLKESPWLPRIALVILIFVILGIMWVAFNYLRKEAKRDRAGQGLPCPNCGQPIHFKMFRVVNSCSHCGHPI